MTVTARLSLILLAGAGLSVLAACGERAQPPAVPAPVEAEQAVPEIAEHHVDEHAEDHSDGAHTHDGEDHHDDHDHDHDHAGGAAHVHGIADLAFSFEGETLSAEMITPLANFGLSEADGVISDQVIASLPTLILLTGGNCVAETPEAAIDTSSGHTDARINFSWTCADPSSLLSASFAGFSTYPGFETVNAVFITDTDQKAAELKPSAPQIALR